MRAIPVGLLLIELTYTFFAEGAEFYAREILEAAKQSSHDEDMLLSAYERYGNCLLGSSQLLDPVPEKAAMAETVFECTLRLKLKQVSVLW